jgi:hypothetical protein
MKASSASPNDKTQYNGTWSARESKMLASRSHSAMPGDKAAQATSNRFRRTWNDDLLVGVRKRARNRFGWCDH